MSIRTLFFIGICALAWAPAPGLTQAATPREEAAGASINYVFASELGSGIYDIGGRSLQVYRLTPRWELREASGRKPGFTFVLPVTVGFFDFDPFDIPQAGLPTSIDAFSITPGLEADFHLEQQWVLTPRLRAGLTSAEDGINGLLYSAGIRLERTVENDGRSFRRTHELLFSGVAYEGAVPDDRFVRLRQGVELRRGTSLHRGGQELEVAGYAVFDIIFDPPSLPVDGSDGEPLQLELGVMLGTRPGIRVWRFGMPQIGLGYRFAGAHSSWRLALGSAF